MKVVRAQFPSGSNNYDYLVLPGDTPEIGDFIITSYNERIQSEGRETGFHVAEPKFAEITGLLVEGCPHKATKPYLMLVPRKLLSARKALRDQVLQHETTKKEARNRLKAILEEQNEELIYAELAKNNPDAAALLAVLRAPMPQLVIEGGTTA